MNSAGLREVLYALCFSVSERAKMEDGEKGKLHNLSECSFDMMRSLKKLNKIFSQYYFLHGRKKFNHYHVTLAKITRVKVSWT